jgi:hypothetical protein
MKKGEDGNKITFSMVLKGERARRFEAIRKYYDLEINTEVIRTLLNEKYKQIFPEKEA